MDTKDFSLRNFFNNYKNRIIIKCKFRENQFEKFKICVLKDIMFL